MFHDQLVKDAGEFRQDVETKATEAADIAASNTLRKSLEEANLRMQKELMKYKRDLRQSCADELSAEIQKAEAERDGRYDSYKQLCEEEFQTSINKFRLQ